MSPSSLIFPIIVKYSWTEPPASSIASPKEVDRLKKLVLKKCQTDLAFIVKNNITNESRIETLFDEILAFHDDEIFMELFWVLIDYAEKQELALAPAYRRLEELLHEGE